jgi:hypothetical protein
MINYLTMNLPSSRKSSIDSKMNNKTANEEVCNSKTIDRQLIEVVHTFVIFLCVGFENKIIFKIVAITVSF